MRSLIYSLIFILANLIRNSSNHQIKGPNSFMRCTKICGMQPLYWLLFLGTAAITFAQDEDNGEAIAILEEINKMNEPAEYDTYYMEKRAPMDRSSMVRFGKRAPMDRSSMVRFGKRAPMDRSSMVRFGKRAPMDRSSMVRFGKRAPMDRSSMVRFGKRAPMDRSSMVRFGKRAPMDRSSMVRFGKRSSDDSM